MYNVLLIDDDAPVLKYLRKLIDWESRGLSIAGETFSSAKALQLFMETKPDIVVTDIGLPQMNGLELAAEFVRIKPDVKIIFLTCHEDFHYVKEALQRGAVDYLIKDELTADQLAQTLDKAVKMIRSAESQIEQLSYREEVNRNLDALKNAVFVQLQKGTDPEQLRQSAKRLGIVWEHPAFAIAVGYLCYSTLVPHYAYHHFALLRYGIYNIACELARDFEGIAVFNDKDDLVVLFNYRPSLKLSVQQTLRAFLEELQAKCRHYLKVQIHFIASVNKVELDSVGAELKRIVGRKRDAFYERQSVYIVGARDEKLAFTPVSGLFTETNADLVRAVQEGDEAQLKQSLRDMQESATARRIDPGELIRMCTSRLRLIELQYAKLRIDEEFYAVLQKSTQADDAFGLVRFAYLQMLKSQTTADEATDKEPKLQQIEAYIIQRLSENITSVDVANHLFLNPSYFSRYFKKLTGDNFTDYVHRYKVKLATKMLETTDESTELIAMKLGYSDRTYFSKVFKKYMNATPGEYKSKLHAGTR